MFVCVTQGFTSDVLKFVDFNQEPTFRGTDVLCNMQAQNLQGHRILVKGIGSGEADIKVSMGTALFPSVASTTVTLAAIDPFMVVPSNDIVLAPSTTVQVSRKCTTCLSLL